jgi:hypothetical protein
VLSARRGAETRSQMLVAKIRKKLSHKKESVHFVAIHQDPIGGDRRMEKIREGGVRESKRPGGGEGLR